MTSTAGASNGGAAEPGGAINAKSITRLLQHSILQLCNEHVGYSHKLQILGVLCMTVDDEQQELVVKVNNTLKRVSPNGPKDPNGLGTHVTTTEGQAPFHHHGTPSREMHPPSRQSPAQNFGVSNVGFGSQMMNGHAINMMNNNNNPERKAHGRKRANPVKVHQVYDEMAPGSDEEEAVTVIPEAPEATDGQEGPEVPESTLNISPSPSPSGGGLSIANRARGIMPSPDVSAKASGSAKRKPSQQFRVPQLTSTPQSSPFQRIAQAGSPFNNSDMPSNADSIEAPQNLSNLSGVNQSGLSLPLFVTGNMPHQNGVINPIEITPDNCSDSEVDEHSRSPSKSPGDLYIDEGQSSVKVKNEAPMNMTYTTPSADGGSEVATALDFSRSGLQSMASLYGLTSAGMGALASQIPLSTLNLLSAAGQTDFSTGLPFTDSDGLTIKYTSTGPYTVGANGKDVSNSSRIKDIIMYDEHSPVSGQKGARMEADFIVDKLGLDGRKRRRRAPEDQLTPEEIAEYLGQPDKADFSFKCKYCSDVFDSVTRYIHHTLSAHQAYICHQCGKSFTTKSSLLRHRPIHTGMRRFACSICKKTFYRKDKCKAHIKRHLGVESGQPATPAQFQSIDAATVEVGE